MISLLWPEFDRLFMRSSELADRGVVYCYVGPEKWLFEKTWRLQDIEQV